MTREEIYFKDNFKVKMEMSWDSKRETNLVILNLIEQREDGTLKRGGILSIGEGGLSRIGVTSFVTYVLGLKVDNKRKMPLLKLKEQEEN